MLSTPRPTRASDAAKLSPSEGKCTVSEQARSGVTSPGVLLSSSSSQQRRTFVNEGEGRRKSGARGQGRRRSLHDSLNREQSLLGRRRVWKTEVVYDCVERSRSIAHRVLKAPSMAQCRQRGQFRGHSAFSTVLSTRQKSSIQFAARPMQGALTALRYPNSNFHHLSPASKHTNVCSHAIHSMRTIPVPFAIFLLAPCPNPYTLLATTIVMSTVQSTHRFQNTSSTPAERQSETHALLVSHPQLLSNRHCCRHDSHEQLPWVDKSPNLLPL